MAPVTARAHHGRGTESGKGEGIMGSSLAVETGKIIFLGMLNKAAWYVHRHGKEVFGEVLLFYEKTDWCFKSF